MSAPTTWILKSSANIWRRSAIGISLQEGRFLAGPAESITAVVPVHLYGQTADMDRILELADAWHLIVVEDACQAHGAEYFSRKDKSLEKGRIDGESSGLQLLSGQESGRLR